MISRRPGGLAAFSPLKSDFGRNVLKLFAANTVAQALSFAAYPVLTRLYRPDQMGILSVVLFTVMILSPLCTLRFEMALPSSRDDQEAGNVLVLCLLSATVVSLAMAVILAILPQSALSAIGPVAPYRFFMPVGLFAFSLYNVLAYEASRLGRYQEISRTRIAQALNGPLLQILLGILGAGTVGLLIGLVVGVSSGTLGLARRLVFASHRAWSDVTTGSVAAAARKFIRFPLYSSWAGVLLTGSTSMLNVVFAPLYGATIGGFLFLGDRVLMQPLRISGNAFLQVFVGEAGKMLRENPAGFHGLFVGVLWKQAALSAAWLGAIFLGAKYLIPVIFGESWGESATYMQILIVGYFPVSATTPVIHTFLLMGKQKLSALLDLLRFGALVAVIALGLQQHATPLQAVLAYSLTQGIAQCVILGLMYRQVRLVARAA